MEDRYAWKSYQHNYGDKYAADGDSYWRLPAGQDEPVRINRADFVAGVQQRQREIEAEDMPLLGRLVEGATTGAIQRIGEGWADLQLAMQDEDPLAITSTRQQLRENIAADTTPYDAIAAVNPGSTGIGEASQYALPGVGAEMALARLGPSLAAQGLVQGGVAAGVGALTQPGDSSERLRRAFEEGATAGPATVATLAVERMANRLRSTRLRNTRFGAKPPEQRRGQMEGADEFLERGYELSPAQASGSDFWQTVEAPLSGAGWLAGIGERNQQRLGNRAIRALGGDPAENSLNATGIRKMYEQIGNRFDEVLDADVSIKLDPKTKAQNLQLRRDLRYADEIGVDELPAELNAREYADYRRNLARAADRLSRSPNAPVGQIDAVENLLESLDTQFLDQAGPEAAKEFRRLREQTKVMFTLFRGRALTADGIINPVSLNTAINDKWPDWRTRGSQSALPETREFFKDVELAASTFARNDPNSATAARQFASMKSIGLTGAVTGIGAYALGADPESAAMLGLGVGIGGPTIYGRLGAALHGRGGPAGIVAGQMLGQQAEFREGLRDAAGGLMDMFDDEEP